MNIANLSSRNLRRAANLKEKIETLISELGTILGGDTADGVGRPSKRKRSPAARARMAAAQRARWAKLKKTGTVAHEGGKPRRKMSAAGRARIAAAAKARWAKAKAQGKNSL
jgi:hypothetical protein